MPENRVLMDPPPSEIGVRIRANGFQLLGYQLSPRTLEIDLRNARESRKGSYISPQSYREQMERQLGQGIGMLQSPTDTIFMNFQELRSKMVPVRVQTNLEFAQNYMLDGELSLEPDQVHLTGPPEEIDSISEVHTELLSLTDLKADFQFRLGLEEVKKYPYTEFSEAQIQISGRVFRFSEIVVEVPVEVIGIPEGIEIQTFPEAVGVLCRGKVAGLKELRPEDFHLVADYTAPESETGRLMLTLKVSPEGVYQTQLLESSVEFIIKRE
jgi:YbbR domain-containing protein